jgi:hypothetical protein
MAKRIERKIANSQRRSRVLNFFLCGVVLILGIIMILAIVLRWFVIF